MKLDIFKKFKEDLIGRFDSLSEEERKKIVAYIYIALTLFTFSFFGIFAIAPTLSTISNLNRQYEDNQIVLESLNQKLTNLQLLDFQYQEIQPHLELIYAAIPRTPEIPTLTRKLENLARGSGVSVKRLTFGNVEIYPNVKQEPIYSFTFTINVVGTQENVNNFIGEIIDFDRVIGAERVLTGLDENNDYSTTITGRAFFSDK